MANFKEYCVIRIVDDDDGILRGMSFLLKCKGWKSRAYKSALEFLTDDDHSQPGCVLLDIRMPDMSGLELQSEMLKRGISTPIVIMTGHADVDTAVQTLKLGAVDFLQKPVKGENLDAVLKEALNRAQVRESGRKENEFVQVWHELSGRERQIASLVGKNLTSRQIAERLGLSERTIQGHRLNLSKKFNVHSPKELLAVLNIIGVQLNDAAGS